MNIAVLKYQFVENKPSGIPDEWPAETIELGDGNQLPGENWVLMTQEQLEEHYTTYADAYDTYSDTLELEVLKDKMIVEIDRKTQSIISNGFVFDSHTFSLSIPAQINWTGLLTFENLLSWPMAVTTIDDQEYVLAQSSLLYFLNAGTTVIATTIASGRNLKLSVKAATSLADLDAIVDSR